MNEDVDILVREYLEEELECIDNDEPNAELQRAFHRVIAWFSVPGEYKEGKHDTQG
jgi:hypothetical protein